MYFFAMSILRVAIKSLHHDLPDSEIGASENNARKNINIF
jgi:hypothetical protein